MTEPQDEPRGHSVGPGESEPAIPMRILDSIVDGLVILNRDWCYTYVNAHAARILGRPRPELLGRCIWDLFPFIVGTDVERQMRRAADEQVTCEFRGHDTAAERFYENRAFPTPDGGVAVHFRDITERRQQELLIQAARAYAESIVTTVREPLLVLDRDLRVVSANRSFYAAFRVRPAETEGRAVYDLGDGQWDIPTLRTLLEEIVPANCWFDDFEVEHDFEHIGRKTMLLNARRFPLEGPFELVLLAIEDITERKRAEQALRESEERFRNYFELGLIGMAITSPTKGCLEVNDQLCQILGYTRDELLRKTWAEMTHPDDLAADVANFDRVMAGEIDSHTTDKRWVRKDSRVIDSTISVRCLRHDDGSVDRFVALLQDITERKRSEKALRESEGRFRGTFENAAVGIAHKDADGRFLRVNEMYCAIVGYTREELLARTFHDITYPDDLAAELEPYTRLMRGELSSYSLEKRYIRKDGSLVWSAVTISLQRDAEARPAYAIAILQDISGRKRLEEELRRAKEAAEAANRAKDEFLANVSHEIRTPFGAILGMTELVLDTPLTDDQRDCLETVKSAAESLLGLVNDLLDFEKMEVGKLELAPADFSFREVLAQTLRAMAVRARMKGLELAWDVEPDVPDALVGDTGRLRQVLLNLVGNAIKFTRQGEVAVRVGVADGTADEGEAVLRFLVIDTGVGIPPDGRERIFRAFEQADSSITRRYGGTGLGLTIAARLVGLMGGTIGVESEPGRGSTFAFTARFGRQPHPPEREVARPSGALHEAAPPTPVAAPLRILVAEDSELNARHLERLLTRSGHDVRVAADGREALNLADETAFDLLLLDLHMPELDGFQVVQAIRERERATGGHLPVIALTARARKEDREHCLAAGMDDYLAKPVRAAELFATIGRAAAGGDVSRPEPGDRASLLDPATLLAACGNEAGLRALCQDFRAYAPARLAEVSDASRARDAPRLREAAHKLCGLLSVFSTAASEVASDLEDHAARGRLDEAGPLVARLGPMLRRLIREVGDISYEGLRSRAGISENPGRPAGA